MLEIKLTIKDCTQCPFFFNQRVHTADSFEIVHRYTCGKELKIIKGYVEWNDKVEIPDWCPILIK